MPGVRILLTSFCEFEDEIRAIRNAVFEEEQRVVSGQAAAVSKTDATPPRITLWLASTQPCSSACQAKKTSPSSSATPPAIASGQTGDSRGGLGSDCGSGGEEGSFQASSMPSLRELRRGSFRVQDVARG